MSIIVKLSRLGILVGVVLVLTTSCKSDELQSSSSLSGSHPCLLLTEEVVPEIISGIEKYPLLSVSYNEIELAADKAIADGIVIPIPVDPGGGYTHEQHKRNYKAMYNAGIAFQVSKNAKYAEFVKEMLNGYAKMYPTLGVHPKQKNQAPGKLFWQGLNESVWLVYTIQAYDFIYNYLSAEERENIEENLFRKVVEFFTIEDSYSFNRVHNHGTWASAGVGMTGMVLNDSNYVQMALYGTDKSGKAGFIQQVEQLFSPDGFYAEGPYYQRYAIMPFILFAQSLDNNNPELNIFEYKNGVLNKAVETLVQLTSESGKFFPLNDAIKSKDYLSAELIYAVNIAYANTQNTDLLSIAQKHNKVMLSEQGLKVAKDVAENKTTPFQYKSGFISDGAEGNMGGVALMRNENSENNLTVMFKATSQGMGHGHFDRLSFLMYENGEEIIQDYGAARFLNIEQKQGGRYLPENKTWAKQTVAHNTVVVNQKSNFNGNLKEASKYYPYIQYAEFDEGIKVVAASDSQCYQPRVLQRIMALVDYDNTSLLVDVYRVNGETPATYDLPLYYMGHIIATNFEYVAAETKIDVMKGKNGYQHLWKLAHADKLNGTTSITWENANRFYTFTSLLDNQSELFITKIGANDPDFNLRNEPGLMVRQIAASDHTFLSVLEAHGKFDPVNETVEGTKNSVQDLQILLKNNDYTATQLGLSDGNALLLIFTHGVSPETTHQVKIGDRTINWEGNYYYEIITE